MPKGLRLCMLAGISVSISIDVSMLESRGSRANPRFLGGVKRH